jgi:hypothetical protein
MQSPYFTHEDYDTALEMHVAENKRRHNKPTAFTKAKIIRSLPRWARPLARRIMGV